MRGYGAESAAFAIFFHWMAEHLRISDAARLLRVSPDTVRRLVDSGRIKTTRARSGRRQIDPAALATYMASQPKAAAAPVGSARNRFEGIVTRVLKDGVTVRFNFAGTPTLVTQIEQGAQADVFASADTANMDRLRADGLTSGEPRVFAHNKLEIAVAPGNPKRIASLADLARPGVVYISAAPTVPAGKYAGKALAKVGGSARSRGVE